MRDSETGECKPIFISIPAKDTNRYNIKQQQLEQLAISSRDSPTPTVKCLERNNNNSLARDVNLLSIDDEKCLQNGQPLPRYNACVLYAEADIEHATDIMNNLESPPYNLKVNYSKICAINT